MRYVLAFACILVPLTAAAQSTPFPTYDVEAACRRSGLNISSCVEYVQPYYDQLQAAWDRVDEPTRRICVNRYRDNIHARYAQIYSCIDAEMQKQDMARQQTNPTRFRY